MKALLIPRLSSAPRGAILRRLMCALLVAGMVCGYVQPCDVAWADKKESKEKKKKKKKETPKEGEDEKDPFESEDEKDPFADQPIGKIPVKKKDEEDDKVPVLREIDDAEAKPLIDELKAVAKSKKPDEIRAVLAKLEKIKHPGFGASLLKLLSHDRESVAISAARALRFRCQDPKVQKKLWANGYTIKRNKRRFGVKGKILRICETLGMKLDKRQYKDVERDWRWLNGNPSEAGGKIVPEYAKYFAALKDKRPCRSLAEMLDEPAPGDVNSPNNPPAAWWEKKWKMWQSCRVHAVRALKAITGQEFEKTAEAKKWIKGPGKKLGFDW